MIYSSIDAIAGFQFNVDGATINSVSGGDAGAAGLMISANDNKVLGFSLAGMTFQNTLSDNLEPNVAAKFISYPFPKAIVEELEKVTTIKN